MLNRSSLNRNVSVAGYLIGLPDLLGEFVFHTCHVSGQFVLAFFGRKSPGILNPCCSIDVNSKKFQFLVHSFSERTFLALEINNLNEEESVVRRWRHCSCYVQESNKILIFGGMIGVSTAANDTLCCQPNGQLIPSEVQLKMKASLSSSLSLQCSPTRPSARHSARLNAYKHFAILSGGLLNDDEPTNEIWFLDTASNVMQWKLFPIKGTVLPRSDLLLVFTRSRITSIAVFRYSHTAEIIDDTLWLLGGINANERYPPGLCQINLVTGEAKEYSIPVSGTRVEYRNEPLALDVLDDVWRTTDHTLQSPNSAFRSNDISHPRRRRKLFFIW